MRTIRALWRLSRMIQITLWRMFHLWFWETVKTKDKRRRDRLKVAWANRIMRALGVKIIKKGQWPMSGVCYAPNHRSYIDVGVMVACVPVSYMGKIEVKKWPMIGQGASMVDTIWVKRENKESRAKSREEIAEKLKHGFMVCVHPEGTTRKAPELEEFKPGLFVIAGRAGVPIIPVAIEYQDPEDAWVGDDTFIPHFLRTFGKKEIVVYVHAGPPMEGPEPIDVLNKTRYWIEKELSEIRRTMGIKLP